LTSYTTISKEVVSVTKGLRMQYLSTWTIYGTCNIRDAPRWAVILHDDNTWHRWNQLHRI